MSRIIAAGIVPAAIEMMDALAMEAAEAAVHVHYPEGAGVPGGGAGRTRGRGRAPVRRGRAALPGGRLDHHPDRRGRGPAGPVLEGPQVGLAAVGRISPDYYVQDGVIPRTALPEVLRRINELADERGLRVANVFHAGDGNLHPLVLYDGEVEGQEERAEELPPRSSTPASTTAARSPASTAWASARSSTCPSSSAPRTSTPCSWCAAPSTPTGGPTRAKCSRPRGCAASARARAGSTAEQAGLAEVF